MKRWNSPSRIPFLVSGWPEMCRTRQPASHQKSLRYGVDRHSASEQLPRRTGKMEPKHGRKQIQGNMQLFACARKEETKAAWRRVFCRCSFCHFSIRRWECASGRSVCSHVWGVTPSIRGAATRLRARFASEIAVPTSHAPLHSPSPPGCSCSRRPVFVRSDTVLITPDGLDQVTCNCNRTRRNQREGKVQTNLCFLFETS